MTRRTLLRAQQGFTYLGLVILLAILGLVAAAGLKMGTLLQRAAAEEELLEIGAQFSEALRSYAAATPQGKPQQPPSLQELLKDPRFPNPRRHLRKIFVDPVTGKAEWGIVWLGDKIGVVGVYSLSEARPLKVANFDIRFQNMENKERISEWKFGIAGGEGLQPSLLTPPNSMTGSGPGAPPSLFEPGAGGVSSVTKAGIPGSGGSGAKPGGAIGAPGDQPMAPPVQDDAAGGEAKPHEFQQPMDVPTDEEREAEEERKRAIAEETRLQAEAEAAEAREAKEAKEAEEGTDGTEAEEVKEAEDVKPAEDGKPAAETRQEKGIGQESNAGQEKHDGADQSTLPPPAVPPPAGGHRRR